MRWAGFGSTKFVADRGGFEPPIRYKRIHAFQACAFNRSATCPNFFLAKQFKAANAKSIIIAALILVTQVLKFFGSEFLVVHPQEDECYIDSCAKPLSPSLADKLHPRPLTTHPSDRVGAPELADQPQTNAHQ